jgi:hypothetical protein
MVIERIDVAKLLGCGSFEKREGFLSQIGILEVDFGNKIKGFQPMIR